VRADAARLRQVIANLVLNAIKFTSAGEIVVRACSTPTSNGAALLRVEISDTGIGIEREALERLFTPFAQADSSTTRNYGGTGLGLAISRELIELMGGELGAKSVPGEGSTFFFELSLERVEYCDLPPQGMSVLAGLRVLVVDDNATSRGILARQLGSWRMSCELAAGAARALELLEEAAAAGIPFTVALIDRNMPEIDGYALARTIRDRPALSAIRLVLLSANGGTPDAPEESFDGFDGLLSKPVRQSRLYEEIGVLIAGERTVTRRGGEPAAAGATGRRRVPDILVVEDTPVNQAVAVRMLEKSGFQAHVAENGRKALEVMSEQSFAAVLMDCQMPELDGYETTRQIRRREGAGRRIPIIAMTANSMQGEHERCLAAGMDDYLSKPLRNRVLKDALLRWLSPVRAGVAADEPVLPAVQVEAGDRPALFDERVVADLESLEGGLLRELVAMFFEQAKTHLAELGKAIGSGAADVLAKAAHKLKGSSLTLGAARVASVAAEIEAVAKAGELGGAGALLEQLRAVLDETAEAFQSRAAVPDPGNNKVGSSRPSLTR
jgi:two-component system, sensor histidine kinase and response regulator